MSILELQKRFQRLGNIRTGTRTEKGFPKKLETFRITSHARGLVQQCADRWGGEVEPWENKWSVITKTAELPVVVPPQDPENMTWYEEWGAGGVKHRCDGETDIITRGPCVCDPDNRACQATTRVNLMLPDIEGIGVWLLTSHGWNAAQEMLASLDTVMVYMQRTGHLPPATLVLEQREVKRPGEQVKRFAVPVLRIDLAVGEVVGLPAIGAADAPVAALEADTDTEPQSRSRLKREAVMRGEPMPDFRDGEAEENPELFEAEVVDITPEIESALWDELYALINNADQVPKKTIPDLKADTKRLYTLMETLGLWAEGTYHLNGIAYCKANGLQLSSDVSGVFRMGDLGPKKDGLLQAFVELSFTHAEERLKEGTE